MIRQYNDSVTSDSKVKSRYEIKIPVVLRWYSFKIEIL